MSRYRPQTKFAKVMFLQVSVCLSTGGDARDAAPPPPYSTRYGDTVNERAVRILMECILVMKLNEINLITCDVLVFDLLLLLIATLCGSLHGSCFSFCSSERTVAVHLHLLRAILERTE